MIKNTQITVRTNSELKQKAEGGSGISNTLQREVQPTAPAVHGEVDPDQRPKVHALKVRAKSFILLNTC